MIVSLVLFQQALIVAAIAAIAAAVFSQLFFPLIQNKVKLFPARFQANIILFVCSLPSLAVLAALLVSFLPSLLHYLGFGPEHCGAYTSSHSHLCSVHPPLPITHWLTWLSTMFLVVLIICVLVLIRGFIFSHGFGRRFAQNDKTVLRRNVWLVKSNIPFVFATGLIRTRIIISTALEKHLSKRQINIVLTHEEEHKKYHDVLRQLIARTVSLLHFPPMRKRLLSQLSLATEKACDEAAVLCAGSRVEVAETLLTIERLYRGNFNRTESVALGVVGNTVVDRVESLLQDTTQQPFHPSWLLFGLAAIVAIVAVTNNQIHFLIERLLDIITH